MKLQHITPYCTAQSNFPVHKLLRLLLCSCSWIAGGQKIKNVHLSCGKLCGLSLQMSEYFFNGNGQIGPAVQQYSRRQRWRCKTFVLWSSDVLICAVYRLPEGSACSSHLIWVAKLGYRRKQIRKKSRDVLPVRRSKISEQAGCMERIA